MRDASFAAAGSVTGTLTVGGTPYAISGSFEISGSDSHETRTVTLAGVSAGEWTTIAYRRARRTSAGIWFADSYMSGTNDVWQFLRVVPALSDLGPTTTPVGATHHLHATDAAITPLAFGLVGIDVANPTATLDVYTAVDGRPVQVDVAASWAAEIKGTLNDIALEAHYAFDATRQVSIAQPDVWELWTSRFYHYTLGHPAGWQIRYSTSKKYVDELHGDTYRFVAAYRQASHGLSLTETANYFKTHASLRGWRSVRFVSIRTARMDGAPARAVTTKVVEGKIKLSVITYLAVRGGYVYYVVVVNKRRSEASDAAFGTTLITTFRFP